MKQKIVVYHHTGLGDHFICNGLVHALLDHYSIDLICKNRYTKTVKHLYEDFEDVNIIPVDNDNNQERTDVLKYLQDTGLPIITVGFEKTDYDNFEDSFYHSAGVNPDDEYNRFKLPSRLDGAKKFYSDLVSKLGKDYIFVHDESSYKPFELKIDSKLPRHTVSKEDTDDVLDYVDAIRFAKEVHVINSGLNNLVFQLFYQGLIETKDVYFHNARKPSDGGIPVKVPSDIKVVEYE